MKCGWGRDRHIQCLFADCDIDDFRNDMHLGPSAHRLMAAEIYHGIDGILLNPNEGTEKRHNRGFAA